MCFLTLNFPIWVCKMTDVRCIYLSTAYRMKAYLANSEAKVHFPSHKWQAVKLLQLPEMKWYLPRFYLTKPNCEVGEEEGLAVHHKTPFRFLTSFRSLEVVPREKTHLLGKSRSQPTTWNCQERCFSLWRVIVGLWGAYSLCRLVHYCYSKGINPLLRQKQKVPICLP